MLNIDANNEQINNNNIQNKNIDNIYKLINNSMNKDNMKKRLLTMKLGFNLKIN